MSQTATNQLRRISEAVGLPVITPSDQLVEVPRGDPPPPRRSISAILESRVRRRRLSRESRPRSPYVSCSFWCTFMKRAQRVITTREPI